MLPFALINAEFRRFKSAEMSMQGGFAIEISKMSRAWANWVGKWVWRKYETLAAGGARVQGLGEKAAKSVAGNTRRGRWRGNESF